MLKLIGLGLRDDDLTVRALEALQEADEAYAEFYTNTPTIDLEKLEESSGTRVQQLERTEVEQDMVPVERAENSDVAFLVSGDPLAATTHYQLKKEAEDRGIEVELYHAPSILTSVSETGLDLYRFGRTVTMPEDITPESVADHIERNDSIGLHTLVLLDIDLEASEAAGKLLELKPEWNNRQALVIERATLDDQEVSVGNLGELGSMSFGQPPHSIILTGELTHKEEEFLEAQR